MFLDGAFRGGHASSWAEHVDYNLRSLGAGDPAQELGYLPPDAVGGIRERFERLRTWNFRVGLCHNDLSPHNTLVDGERVSLLDWGCATAAAVPDHELVSILRAMTQNGRFDRTALGAFTAGYGLGAAWLDEAMPRLESLLLLRVVDTPALGARSLP